MNEITLEKVKEIWKQWGSLTSLEIDWLITEVEEAKKLLLSAWHLLDIAEPNAKITEELEQYLRKNLK